MPKRTILLSENVELNAGPVRNNTSSLTLISNTSADFLLNYRLHRYGLSPFDVGGGCDCFFLISITSVGDSSHHLAIRHNAVQYLRQNPERFIESILNLTTLQ